MLIPVTEIAVNTKTWHKFIGAGAELLHLATVVTFVLYFFDAVTLDWVVTAAIGSFTLSDIVYRSILSNGRRLDNDDA